MLSANALLTCGALALYLLFASSVFFVFEMRGSTSRGLTLLKVGAVVAMGVISSCIYLSAQPGTGPTTVAGLIMLASALLYVRTVSYSRKQRLSVAFSSDIPTFHYQNGPYRFVRHPFYASYLLGYVGGTIASGNLWLPSVLATIFMACVYVRAAQYEEAKFAASPFAQQYSEYKTRTGMLLPRVALLPRLR